MVTGPQGRILTRLSSFPSSLELAWDVPRAICLPGLSEHLGVVRSALHSPLKELLSKGLITERKAHVVGGGNRKRSVYHITEFGREECDGLEHPKNMKLGTIYGNLPPKITLHGRVDLIDELKSYNKLIITGLPGIGKTSILRTLAEDYSTDGKIVRYASMDKFKDVTEIFQDWKLNYTSVSAVLNETKNEVLILDELQEISQRHLKDLESFAKKATNLILASRAPLVIDKGFEIVEVMPLETKYAVNLLPNDLENPYQIAERLGCHPLAMQMYDENSDLPESGADLQKWVQEVVLSGLGNEICALDELSLLPVPVPAELLEHQNFLNYLDDFALLRWVNSGVELHHLVRNVRSAMLTKSDYRKAAEYWSKVDGDIARLVEIYHIIHSGGDVESLLLDNAESLMVNSGAALASLVSSALFKSPSQNLHRLAASIAIERGEVSVAKSHLKNCNAIDLDYRISILEGGKKVNLPSEADYKLILSEATRRLDDRLPGEPIEYDIQDILDRIDLSDLDLKIRKTILVSIAHIRHAYFLANQNWASADKIRRDLESLTHPSDAQLVSLRLRSEIAQTPQNSPSFEKLVNSVFSKSGLRSKMLQIALVLRCDNSRAVNLLNRIEMPSSEAQASLISARRLSAIIWYLRAKYKTHNPISSMSEAVSLWKLSLCPVASKKASELMHSML